MTSRLKELCHILGEDSVVLSTYNENLETSSPVETNSPTDPSQKSSP